MNAVNTQTITLNTNTTEVTVKDLNILQQYTILRVAEYLVNEIDEPQYDSVEESVEFVLEDILYTLSNNEEPNEVFELYLEFFVDLQQYDSRNPAEIIPGFLRFSGVGASQIVKSYDDDEKPEDLRLDVDEYIRQGQGGRWYVYKLKQLDTADYLLPWTEGIPTLEGYNRDTMPTLDVFCDLEDWTVSYRSIRGTAQQFVNKYSNKIIYKAYCDITNYWKLYAASRPIEIKDNRIVYK